MNINELKFKINAKLSVKLQKDLIRFRQALHADPELSNQEFNTQQKIIKELKKCKVFEITTVDTGVVARIEGRDQTLDPVAIRVDIDALPIKESTNLTYSSKNSGVMHACGHDVHATWGIGVAHCLSETQPLSDIILIFQPAEELATGALSIIKSDALPSNIAAIFGGHVDRRYTEGEVVCQPGIVSSYSDKFTVTILGKTAHAARPNEGHNPIPKLAEICQSIVFSNSQYGDATNLITMTQINGGERHNIIPNQALVSGSIRCLDPKKRAKIHQELFKLNDQLSDINVNVDIQESTPAVINSSKINAMARAAIINNFGEKSTLLLKNPNMASEDFGYYLEHYPGWYFRFGAGYKGDAFVPVHTSRFYAEDETIFIGAIVLSECAQLFHQMK